MNAKVIRQSQHLKKNCVNPQRIDKFPEEKKRLCTDKVYEKTEILRKREEIVG